MSYALPVFIALLGLLVASLSADPVVNRTVGESVVLPAGLSPQENPSEVDWKWGGESIAVSDMDVPSVQFRDRVHLNRRDWSLTINLLRAEDSGEYKRVARAASGQLPSHTVTLRVYEKIKLEVTTKPSNETCRATLLCTANQREHVSYRWKREDQDLPEHAGILQVSLSPGEINVIFTCIASNPVSEATASIRESCAGISSSSVGGSFCVLKSVLLSLGLVLMISAVIGVHVRECAHTKRNVRRHRAACET
ncbi:SLAM family member 8-like isoform X5 [Acipenser oxyrinchus oxyrinchus]|uniref:SLAM family member 8-like isoform X5 n=1 Tax=Acipenser oxyrinchus oxyrinchus TaxID=40147 RepID=A0AAD8CHJ7_ACIOX|nr:SLAM family member 8-like isoform X5 [Acipenser oxyrinchus oxyrinchus]